MKRKTHAEVREAARIERDIEMAAFLDHYIDMLEGPGSPVNPHRHPPEVEAALVCALRGFAGSIRAGLVE